MRKKPGLWKCLFVIALVATLAGGLLTVLPLGHGSTPPPTTVPVKTAETSTVAMVSMPSPTVTVTSQVDTDAKVPEARATEEPSSQRVVPATPLLDSAEIDARILAEVSEEPADPLEDPSTAIEGYPHRVVKVPRYATEMQPMPRYRGELANLVFWLLPSEERRVEVPGPDDPVPATVTEHVTTTWRLDDQAELLMPYSGTDMDVSPGGNVIVGSVMTSTALVDGELYFLSPPAGEDELRRTVHVAWRDDHAAFVANGWNTWLWSPEDGFVLLDERLIDPQTDEIERDVYGLIAYKDGVFAHGEHGVWYYAPDTGWALVDDGAYKGGTRFGDDFFFGSTTGYVLHHNPVTGGSETIDVTGYEGNVGQLAAGLFNGEFLLTVRTDDNYLMRQSWGWETLLPQDPESFLLPGQIRVLDGRLVLLMGDLYASRDDAPSVLGPEDPGLLKWEHIFVPHAYDVEVHRDRYVVATDAGVVSVPVEGDNYASGYHHLAAPMLDPSGTPDNPGQVFWEQWLFPCSDYHPPDYMKRVYVVDYCIYDQPDCNQLFSTSGQEAAPIVGPINYVQWWWNTWGGGAWNRWASGSFSGGYYERHFDCSTGQWLKIGGNRGIAIREGRWWRGRAGHSHNGTCRAYWTRIYMREWGDLDVVNNSSFSSLYYHVFNFRHRAWYRGGSDVDYETSADGSDANDDSWQVNVPGMGWVSLEGRTLNAGQAYQMRVYPYRQSGSTLGVGAWIDENGAAGGGVVNVVGRGQYSRNQYVYFSYMPPNGAGTQTLYARAMFAKISPDGYNSNQCSGSSCLGEVEDYVFYAHTPPTPTFTPTPIPVVFTVDRDYPRLIYYGANLTPPQPAQVVRGNYTGPLPVGGRVVSIEVYDAAGGTAWWNVATDASGDFVLGPTETGDPNLGTTEIGWWSATAYVTIDGTTYQAGPVDWEVHWFPPHESGQIAPPAGPVLHSVAGAAKSP
jgi:hypothetical protein